MPRRNVHLAFAAKAIEGRVLIALEKWLLTSLVFVQFVSILKIDTGTFAPRDPEKGT